jgi:hypothetical protein
VLARNFGDFGNAHGRVTRKALPIRRKDDADNRIVAFRRARNRKNWAANAKSAAQADQLAALAAMRRHGLALEALHLLLKRLHAAVERIHARHRLVSSRLCVVGGIKRLIGCRLRMLNIIHRSATAQSQSAA